MSNLLLDLRTPAHVNVALLIIKKFNISKIIICSPDYLSLDLLIKNLKSNNLKIIRYKFSHSKPHSNIISLLLFIYKVLKVKKIDIIFHPLNWGILYYLFSIIHRNIKLRVIYEDGTGSFLNYQKNNYSFIIRSILKIFNVNLECRGTLKKSNIKFATRYDSFYKFIGGENLIIKLDPLMQDKFQSLKYKNNSNITAKILLLSNQDYELKRVDYNLYINSIKKIYNELYKRELLPTYASDIIVSLHHQENFLIKKKIYQEIFGEIQIIPPNVPAEDILNSEQISVIISPYNSVAMYALLDNDNNFSILLYKSFCAFQHEKYILFNQLKSFTGHEVIHL